MLVHIVRRSFVWTVPSVLALVLMGLCNATNAQDTYFPTDGTINSAIQGAIVGFADSNDLTNGTNPSSPTVGVILNGDIFPNRLQAYNSSTVNVNPGAVVAGGIQAYNSSTINITGGRVEANLGIGLLTYNSSTTNISGGFVNGPWAYDNSTVNVSDGMLTGMRAFNDSMFNFCGGTVAGAQSYDSSTVKISGGSITGDVDANNYSMVNLSGGAINGRLVTYDNSLVNITGGSIHLPILAFGGTINFYGTGLSDALDNPNFNGTSQYTLMGHLADGTDINGEIIDLANASNASFTLNNATSAVPEPGNIVVLGALYLTGVAFLRRRAR